MMGRKENKGAEEGRMEEGKERKERWEEVVQGGKKVRKGRITKGGRKVR